VAKATKIKKKTKDNSLGFQIKMGNFQEYGLVTTLPGASHCQVQLFKDSSVKFCRLSKSNWNHHKFAQLWDIVLVSIRPFDPSRGDVSYVYNAIEREQLLAINHIACFDPASKLPLDCVFRIFENFEVFWHRKVGKRVSRSWYLFIGRLLREEETLDTSDYDD